MQELNACRAASPALGARSVPSSAAGSSPSRSRGVARWWSIPAPERESKVLWEWARLIHLDLERNWNLARAGFACTLETRALRSSRFTPLRRVVVVPMNSPLGRTLLG